MSYLALSRAALLRATQWYSQSHFVRQRTVLSFHCLRLQRCPPIPIQSPVQHRYDLVSALILIQERKPD
jgi:hypothetical protein